MWNRKEKKPITMKHYSPDFNVTPTEYIYSSSIDRIRANSGEVARFLRVTAPDAKCCSYFDQRADDDGKSQRDSLRSQRAEHIRANSQIVAKHNADKLNLSKDRKRTEDLIAAYREELIRLQPYIEIIG